MKYLKIFIVLISITLSLTEDKSKYILFSKLPYCTNDLKNSECEVCKQLKEKGYKVIYEMKIDDDKHNNKMVISEKDGEVVISFGGPKSTKVGYFQDVYKNGFSEIELIGNQYVETDFWNIYKVYRHSLIERLKDRDRKSVV